MTKITRGGIHALLILVIAVEAWGLYHLWSSFSPASSFSISTSSPVKTGRPAFPGGFRSYVKGYKIIAKKNLFSQEREYTSTASTETTASNAPRIVLNGITEVAGKKVALIKVPSRKDGDKKWFHVGDKINAWEIKTILADKMILQQGEASVEIKLFTSDSPDSPPAKKSRAKSRKRKTPRKPVPKRR